MFRLCLYLLPQKCHSMEDFLLCFCPPMFVIYSIPQITTVFFFIIDVNSSHLLYPHYLAMKNHGLQCDYSYISMTLTLTGKVKRENKMLLMEIKPPGDSLVIAVSCQLLPLNFWHQGSRVIYTQGESETKR